MSSPSIYGVDVAAGAKRLLGKTDKYLKILYKFVDSEETPPPFDPNAGAGSPLKEYIHTLKGMTGNLCIQDVFAMCSELDALINAGTPDSELYENIISETQKVRDAVKAYRDAVTESGA